MSLFAHERIRGGACTYPIVDVGVYRRPAQAAVSVRSRAVKCREPIDQYRPDLVYHDNFELAFGRVGLEMAVHYHNASWARNDGRLESACAKAPTRPRSGRFAEGGTVSPDMARDICYAGKRPALHALMLGWPKDKTVRLTLPGRGTPVGRGEVGRVKLPASRCRCASGARPMRWRSIRRLRAGTRSASPWRQRSVA